MSLHRLSSLALLLLPLTASAHGVHKQQAPLSGSANPDDSDWGTLHMQKEHHITNFDPSTFFTMHDFDSDSFWEPSEITRTYGFDNDGTSYDGSPSLKHKLTPENANRVVNTLLEMYDTDKDGRVSKDEFVTGVLAGKRLPDFGTGPGHHGDDEYEYEIHHWERFHTEEQGEGELTHEEDKEHFRKHDEREAREMERVHRDARPIVEANIPSKFRRG